MLRELEWKVHAGSLRGVSVGSDLTQCASMWFQTFVENARAFIILGLNTHLEMRGKTVLYKSDRADTVFRQDDHIN
jgi:hypothetical protein